MSEETMAAAEEAWRRDEAIRAEQRKVAIQRKAYWIQCSTILLFFFAVLLTAGGLASNDLKLLCIGLAGLGTGLFMTLIAQVMYCRAALEAKN